MNKKSAMTIVFFTVFIDMMGFGILIPILPTFASIELNVPDYGIGIVVAVYSLVQFLFNPVFGRISDKHGRRPIILVTLLITSLSYMIFSVADSFFLLLLARIMAGFGGSNLAVAQAYMADITEQKDRARGMGLIGAGFGLGFVFGPLIGGWLSGYGYAVAGYASAAFAFFAFLFALFSLEESNKNKNPKGEIDLRLIDAGLAKKVLTNPSIGILVIIFFILIFSIANIYGTFSLLGYKHYNFTDQQNGYLFGIMGIVGVIVQGGLIRLLSEKFLDKTLLLTGTILMMLGLGFMPFGITFMGVAIVVAVLSIGTGMLQPTILSMISKYSPDNQQGEILGVNQSFGALARVFGPMWGGLSFDFLGYQFPFLTGAAFTLIVFFITLFLLNTKNLKKVEHV
ncbi:MAG: MFS transporter [Ignavibacteria bacterium]|jgi:multidrug resistance protein